MTWDELQKEWDLAGESLQRFPATALDGVPIPQSAIQFLAEVGLPHDAAPFLTFEVPVSTRLPTVDELFGCRLKIENHCVIGSNGSGDPIIVFQNGRVMYLNHDAEFSQIYINKDVQILSESLLRYGRLISETQQLRGPDAYLDGMVPQHLRTEFLSYLRRVDAISLEGQTLWTEEVASWANSTD